MLNRSLLVLISVIISLLAILPVLVVVQSKNNINIVGTYLYICENRYIPDGKIRDDTFVKPDNQPMRILVPDCHYNYLNIATLFFAFTGVISLTYSTLWYVTHRKKFKIYEK